MGDSQNHNGKESPFEKKSGAESDAELSASSKTPALNQEAEKLLAEKKELIDRANARLEYPALNAMAARAVYFGVQGRLVPGMEQITKVMSSSGPIGEAAVTRMKGLESKGWKFGSLSPNDTFIANQTESKLGRAWFALIHGGYNDAASGKVAHNALGSLVNSVVGLSDGADKDAANKYIHELAHGKHAAAYQQYEASPRAREALAKLPLEARRIHGAEMVQEEFRAVSAQVVSNIRQQGEFRAFLAPQTKGLTNYPLEAGLRQGQLGAMTKEVWPYEGPKVLSRAEANSAVNEYQLKEYGPIFEGGKLNQKAELAIAAEIGRLPLEAPSGTALQAASLGAETAFTSTRGFAFLSRAGQAAGSLLLLSSVADIRNQFKISTGAGVGRVASVGSDWAGFEGGTAIGGFIGEGVTQLLIKTNPRLAMLAMPLFSMGAGLVSAQVMHESVSKPIELRTKSKVDDLLAKDH